MVLIVKFNNERSFCRAINIAFWDALGHLMQMNGNKPTCLESDKMFGRYHAIIMPCASIIMQGVEALTPSSGTYCCFREASLAFDAFDTVVKCFFGSLSA